MVVGNAAAAPQVGAFLVPGAVLIARKHGESQPILGQTQILFAGQKFPTPRDHFLLEIIAQRPVAQHFKESQVAEIAHVLDIAGADALLHVGQAGARRMLLAHQIGHQRMHTGGGEQNGRVVFRNNGSTGDHSVTVILKELQEHGAQIGGMIGLHNDSLS